MSARTPVVAERLERRRLLATVVSNLDVWTINGSEDGEAITVSLRARDQRLLAYANGELIATRLLRHVGLVEVLGNSGHDTVTIDLHDPDSKLMVWVNGGPGRDRLFGGACNENLGGGSGRDLIDGGRGDDIVRGGTDRDDVSGGDGNDYVQGNGGDDVLSGGWGDDRVTGGTGRDQLRGGEGDDRIAGGKDTDTIKGGGGTDVLEAGGGVGNVVFRQDLDEVVSGQTDSIETDDVDEGLERIQTQEELRAWLIERSVAQWRDQFGKPANIVYWAWNRGDVFIASSSNALVAAFDSGGAAPAPGAPQSPGDSSQTNTQELGVDEADIVETDGQYLYLLHNDELLIVDARDAADLKILSRTKIDGSPRGIYLEGDRLTVLSEKNGYFIAYGGLAAADFSILPPTGDKPQLHVTVFDVSDRSNPTEVNQTTLDGSLTDSRVIDGRLYLVHQDYLNAPAPLIVENGEGEEVYESEASYRARLANGAIDEILPDYTVIGAGATAGQVIAPPDVFVHDGERLDATTVTLINLRDGAPTPTSSITVIGANGNVYASANSLYLAGSGWTGSESGTTLVKFGLGTDQVSLQATGKVDGTVLNQFSMDEEGEFFRIATTSGFGTSASNRVAVLDQVADDLNVIGEVENLAEGESIFAARFIGDRAYLVTFLQVDPLFVLDLSDPTAPQVKGELKIPGFSNYLHPVGENFLIGLGSIDVGGGLMETQVSLFDVSDPANPTRVDAFEMGGWNSLAAHDHHAFSYFADQGILAIPSDGNTTLQVLKVDTSSGFEDMGIINHGDAQVLRSVRIGANVFSIGTDAIRAHALADIGDEIDALMLPAWEPEPAIPS